MTSMQVDGVIIYASICVRSSTVMQVLASYISSRCW